MRRQRSRSVLRSPLGPASHSFTVAGTDRRGSARIDVQRLEGTGLDPCRPRHEERAAPSPSGDAHPLERDTAQVVEQHLEAVYREPVRRTLRVGLPSGIRRRFGLPARKAVRRLPRYPVGPVPRYGRDGSHGRTSFSSAAARYWSRISALARCPTVGVSIGEMAWNDSLSLESGGTAGVGLPPLSGRDGAIPETPSRSRNHRWVGPPKQQRPPPAPETVQGFGTAPGVCRNFRNGEAG